MVGQSEKRVFFRKKKMFGGQKSTFGSSGFGSSGGGGFGSSNTGGGLFGNTTNTSNTGSIGVVLV